MEKSRGHYEDVPNVVRVSNEVEFAREKALRDPGDVDTDTSDVGESHEVEVRDGW